MNVKFKTKDGEVIYTPKELQIMSKGELKQIKRELQNNIDEVGLKRADYNLKNQEKYGSKKYLEKINSYKKVITILKSQIVYVNKFIEKCKRDEVQENEHWLYNFYMTTKKSIRKGKFNKIVKLTDECTQYHVDFEIGE